MNIKWFLVFPFISSLCIVLNLYNGDVLGIPCNIEYLLWYLPSLFFILFSCKSYYYSELFVCVFGITANIYWHYAWIEDAKTNHRHRTEYYDTQCLMSAFLFVLLQKETKKYVEITNI